MAKRDQGADHVALQVGTKKTLSKMSDTPCPIDILGKRRVRSKGKAIS